MKPHEYHNFKGTIIVYAILVIFLSILGSLGISQLFNITVLPASISLACLIGVIIILKNQQIDLEVKLALAITAASGFSANFLLTIVESRHCLNPATSYWLTGISLFLGIASAITIVTLTSGLAERRQITKFSLLVYLTLTLGECLISLLC